MKKRQGCILGLAVTFAVVVASCGGLALYNRERAFNPDVWRSDGHHVRGRMVLDLLRSKRLDGLTAAEAKRVLGEPDWADDTTLSYRYTGQAWPLDPFSGWSEILELEIDANGRVANVTQSD